MIAEDDCATGHDADNATARGWVPGGGPPRLGPYERHGTHTTAEFIWDSGLTLHQDLTRELEPLDDWERASILGRPFDCGCEPIHVYVPGSEDDPRTDTSLPGVVIHRGPPLHPDDLTVVDGLPVTSPSRTLIDLAETLDAGELRAAFARARENGLLDPEALRAARARVEWRPTLAMLDEVIDEFC